MGADLTALHILPKLKELFDELAFSQEISKGPATVSRNLKDTKLKTGGDFQIESRMDLV
jgi:WD repeat-containing protein 81